MSRTTSITLASLAALLPLPAAAQEAGVTASSLLTQLIFAVGISPHRILWALVVTGLLWCVNLYVATRLAGLPATIGRTILAIVLMMLVSIPIFFVLVAMIFVIGTWAATFLVFGGQAATGTLAIKWIYSTDFSRGFLVHLVSALLTAWCMIALVLVLF